MSNGLAALVDSSEHAQNIDQLSSKSSSVESVETEFNSTTQLPCKVDAFSVMVNAQANKLQIAKSEAAALRAAVWEKFERGSPEDAEAWMTAQAICQSGRSHRFEPALETLWLSQDKLIVFLREREKGELFSYYLAMQNVGGRRVKSKVQVSPDLVAAAVFNGASLIAAALMSDVALRDEVKNWIDVETFSRFEREECLLMSEKVAKEAKRRAATRL